MMDKHKDLTLDMLQEACQDQGHRDDAWEPHQACLPESCPECEHDPCPMQESCKEYASGAVLMDIQREVDDMQEPCHYGMQESCQCPRCKEYAK